jgi:hypothetical protein
MSLSACRLPLAVACYVPESQYRTVPPSLSSLCSFRLVPLSHVHLFPVRPLQVLLQRLTRALHFMSPWATVSQVQGTSAQLFRHEVYYYRLRPCPRPPRAL